MPAAETAHATAATAGAPPFAVELVGIDKRFGPVHANRDVSIAIARGEIHGIIGENGAGKSTLMSILYGFYEADRGEVRVAGRSCSIRSSADAIAAGIGMVHQHFMLVDGFTVLENVMLGAEGGALLKKHESAARAELRRLAGEFGLDLDLDATVGELPVGDQQRVEILKALYRHCEVLILDEPTGVLTPQETDQLFRILRSLKSRGVTVLLITHKLKEVLAITDHVTVMRRGEVVADRRTAETDAAELAELMVGRKVRLDIDKTPARPGKAEMVVENLALTDARGITRLSDISFSLHGGEIVGIAGVSGNGQSELLEVLAGMRPPGSGRIRLGDAEVTSTQPTDPAALRRLGVAHVPEDRHRLGLVPGFAAYESAVLGYQADDDIGSRLLLAPAAMRARCAKLMQGFDVRPPDPLLGSTKFSGGNQQKLILAREMARTPRVLLVGQPTRGVDIGAIEFIHREILAMRDQGCAVLLVSVELDEILALADRILVMNQGRIVGEVAAAEADERKIGILMAGCDPATGAPL
ncbi:nucleoside ABC transporter ATP-binding protein [Dongia mobilis]|uniref:Nucleoside ABC transporter ATP-binding protein n=1 Tax=Dongia mobilis TaxID=578943 RepID=A0A4R6X1G1_9PROT|nr:ABC transporter ATP-binding protein [Dongia mobilis]TDQ84298.1 nucleoside ABC transporter ATP-binding protein [Dongia mobilis]